MTSAPGSADAPSSVRTSALLYTIQGVLRLLGAVLALVLLPQTIAYAQRTVADQVQGQDTGGVDVTSVATGAAIGGTVLGVVGGVVFGVLTIVFARKLLLGRNWARIVLLVFAVLALPGLFAFGGPTGIITGLVSFATAVLGIIAAVLSFLRTSSPWFRRTTMPPTAI